MNPLTLLIRSYTNDDVTPVRDLVLSIQQQEFGVPITLEEQPDLLDPTAFFSDGASGFWLAAVDEKIVGTIGLLDIGNQQAVLRKMFVHKAYRGGRFNIAGQLLETAQHHAKKMAIKHIYLSTSDKYHAAHRFYEKNGFTQIAQTALPSSFPLVGVDKRFYHRDLF